MYRNEEQQHVGNHSERWKHFRPGFFGAAAHFFSHIFFWLLAGQTFENFSHLHPELLLERFIKLLHTRSTGTVWRGLCHKPSPVWPAGLHKFHCYEVSTVNEPAELLFGVSFHWQKKCWAENNNNYIYIILKKFLKLKT